jgi:hypothetical protein
VVVFFFQKKAKNSVRDAYEKKGFFVNSQKRIYIFEMSGACARNERGGDPGQKRIVSVVVLFRRFLINDGYF